MKKSIIIFTICGLLLSFAPIPASAFSLVPCGSSEYPEPCQFKHIAILIVRMINYLISVAAFVAMYHILLGGGNLITALGNAEKIQTAKTGVSNAVVGFAIVALAFVFVNLLMNGVFGSPDMPREWYRLECIYGVGSDQCQFGISNYVEQ